jgi:hypothetical protein
LLRQEFAGVRVSPESYFANFLAKPFDNFQSRPNQFPALAFAKFPPLSTFFQ